MNLADQPSVNVIDRVEHPEHVLSARPFPLGSQLHHRRFCRVRGEFDWAPSPHNRFSTTYSRFLGEFLRSPLVSRSTTMFPHSAIGSFDNRVVDGLNEFLPWSASLSTLSEQEDYQLLIAHGNSLSFPVDRRAVAAGTHRSSVP